jgi:hypothetical protein
LKDTAELKDLAIQSLEEAAAKGGPDQGMI